MEWKQKTANEVISDIKSVTDKIRNGMVGTNPFAIDCRLLVEKSPTIQQQVQADSDRNLDNDAFEEAYLNRMGG